MFLKKKKNAAASAPAKRGLQMSRSFDLPRGQLFELYTKGEHVMNWWGPRGYRMSVLRQELEPGGIILYKQESPDGIATWGKFTYRDLAAPDKLVSVNAFADAEGRTVRAFFSKDWPLEIVNTVTLEEQADGTTKLTLHALPEDAKKAENRAFDALRDYLRQGYSESFDMLEEYIALRAQA